MKKLIAIYGGTDLDPATAAFVEALSYAILQSVKDAVIVTGGFYYRVDETGKRMTGIATDYAAYIGAEKFATDKKLPLEQCLKTWIPEPTKDRHKEHVERFEKGDSKIVDGASAQQRRFEIVNRVDAVITVKGRKNTAMVLDFAIIVNRPFLPLSFTGGDSKEYWKDNEALIRATFKIVEPGFINQIKEFSPATASASETTAFLANITDALEHGLKKTCLVLRQYGGDADLFYESDVKEIIMNTGFRPINIKEDINKGNILSIYIAQLTSCDVVMADITEANPNVMYEIGQAHARSIPVILFCREKIDAAFIAERRLPFYLLQDKVDAADVKTESGKAFIKERLAKHLEGVRKKV